MALRSFKKLGSEPRSARTAPRCMEDGTEFETGPGEVMNIPSGHDAWVVGNEPVVLIDWEGARNHAKRSTQAGSPGVTLRQRNSFGSSRWNRVLP